MTVAELEATMPNHEFRHWYAFLARRAQQQEVEQKMADARQARR
jgi:hypothetical protein